MKLRSYLKKMVCCLVAGACLIGAGGFAFAAEDGAGNQDGRPATQNQLTSSLFQGTVTLLEDGRVGLEYNDENGTIPEVILNITDETRILNAVTGMPVALADLKEGETVYAYAGPAMTMSLPPITNAELILCQIPADFAVPLYAEIESIQSLEDGALELTTNRDMLFLLNDKTEVFPYLTKNIVTKDSLVPGTKVLAWYDKVMTSEPAKAAPSKVMVFAYEYNGYLEASVKELKIDGEKVALKDDETPYLQDGSLMLPLRRVAEALGCQVAWDGKTGTISVTLNGEELYNIDVDENQAMKGEFGYALSPQVDLDEGVTFVSALDLSRLHDVKLVK